MVQKSGKPVAITIKHKGGGVSTRSAASSERTSGFTPHAGDIIHLDFNPATGREMKDPHFALVVSEYPFNQRGLAWVCAISQGVGLSGMDGPGLAVTLMGTGTKTQGKIHVYQMRAVDLRLRQAKFIEKAPATILTEVRDAVAAIAGITDQ